MKESFPLAAAAGSSAKPFPRTKDNQNASKATSFHERSNYIGNRDGTAHKMAKKPSSKESVFNFFFGFQKMNTKTRA
jgi:hypothetical protein